jgi:hypothetical protein
LLGRLGILAAVREGELAISVDQASVHKELARKGGIAQLLQERINLLAGQLP